MSNRDMISKADVLDIYAELYDEFDDAPGIRKVLHRVYDKINGLKEQEPVKPIKTKKEIDFRSEIVDAFCCGNCRHELDHCEKWRYCPKCGRAVKWDA